MLPTLVYSDPARISGGAPLTEPRISQPKVEKFEECQHLSLGFRASDVTIITILAMILSESSTPEP